MKKPGFVYILTNKNNTTLYIGVTSHLNRRVAEHKSRLWPGFTSQYNCTKLVFYEKYERIGQAITREKQLKNWKRK
jgi:putative endonuclease